MMNYIKIGTFLALLFCVTGCDEIRNLGLDDVQNISSFKENESMDILDISFSPTYKEMTLDVDLTSDLSGRLRSDTANVRIAVHETVRRGIGFEYDSKEELELVRIRNVAAEEAAKQNFKVLAIVDLTLPQPQVDEQREALQEIKNVYGEDKVFVSFMHDFEVSETFPLTDYVFQHYFVSKENSGKLLFRTIVEKRDEVTKPDGPFPTTNNQALVIFSDGAVYDENDQPFDAKYYEYKAELDKVYPQMVKDTLSIYYVRMTDASMEGGDEASLTLQRMCRNYEGLYQEKFDWNQMEADFKKKFGLDYCDYRLTLANLDGKVYRGYSHTLFVECYDKNDALLASDSVSYALGSIYEPVIVNGATKFKVILKGIIIILISLLVVYLVFQYAVPAVQYLYFLKKHVITYKGKGMSVNNRLIGDSCYMCKDEFKEGEKIVVKCEHTVHKSCWDENEYKCPEYGRHCKSGSHYFNYRELWDSRNAPSYMNKVLVGCIAALVSWMFFLNDFHLIPHEILKNMMQQGTPGALRSSSEHTNFINQLRVIPYFGFCVGLFNVFILGLLSVISGNWLRRLGRLLLATFIAAACCWSFFAIESMIVLVMGMTAYSFIIEWIPWVLSSTLILYLLTRLVGGKLEKKKVLIACVMGILSMHIWQFFYDDSYTDYRLLLLFSFVFYSVTIALCLSHLGFRSDHFFLSVSGSIKPMDIALYKWFRTAPNGIVTIGRSVDCNLQINWDINGKISPVHAEIRMQKGRLRLYALEEGVMVDGKHCPLDKGIRLYHGMSFSIANTVFVYKEDPIL